MSESVESYLARGDQVRVIPAGQSGEKKPLGNEWPGHRLREKLATQADQHRALVARKSGGGK